MTNRRICHKRGFGDVLAAGERRTQDCNASIASSIYANPDTPDVVTARGAAGTRSVQRVLMQNRRRTVTVQALASEDFVVESKTPSAAR
jgi:hypothetical protein